jgi:hypothetical protein
VEAYERWEGGSGRLRDGWEEGRMSRRNSSRIQGDYRSIETITRSHLLITTLQSVAAREPRETRKGNAWYCDIKSVRTYLCTSVLPSNLLVTS